ncbi:MAG: GTP cyclohydrolase I, partial [Nitrospiria bacterium]
MKEFYLETEKVVIKDLIERLLISLGEDPNREGLKGTPERVEKSLRFLTNGYHKNVERVLNDAFFTISHEEMVIIKGIQFFSLCEHHLLPFFGECH